MYIDSDQQYIDFIACSFFAQTKYRHLYVLVFKCPLFQKNPCHFTGALNISIIKLIPELNWKRSFSLLVVLISNKCVSFNLRSCKQCFPIVLFDLLLYLCFILKIIKLVWGLWPGLTSSRASRGRTRSWDVPHLSSCSIFKDVLIWHAYKIMQ